MAFVYPKGPLVIGIAFRRMERRSVVSHACNSAVGRAGFWLSRGTSMERESLRLWGTLSAHEVPRPPASSEGDNSM